MKVYLENRQDTPRLKQIPDAYQLLDFLNFTKVDDDPYTGFSAVLRGDDVILDTGDDDFSIYYNAGKYLDEFLNLPDDFESWCSFEKRHPDVRIEFTADVWSLLN